MTMSTPTPMLAQFNVDRSPPQLTIGKRPRSLHGDTSATVSFSGTDGQTPPDQLGYRVELFRTVDNEVGVPQVIASQPAGVDAFQSGMQRATFDDLESGVYRIRVTVRDAAGNVTSSDVGFAVRISGGCHAMPGRTSAEGLPVLLLGLLLLPQRRRQFAANHRGRAGQLSAVICVLCATTLPAHAVPVGSTFSGVTAADPAAIYWNPAALTRLKGTHGHAYGSTAFISGRYDRDTPSPFTGQPYDPATFSAFRPNLSIQLLSDFGLDDWRFGIGVATPITDGGTWDSAGPGHSATRHYGINGRIIELFISPAVAYRINDYISLGFGVDVVGINIQHHARTDMAARINRGRLYVRWRSTNLQRQHAARARESGARSRDQRGGVWLGSGRLRRVVGQSIPLAPSRLLFSHRRRRHRRAIYR